WSAGATLSQANRIMGTAVLRDSLYSIGGVSSASVYLTTNERYDIRSNSWVLRAPLPSAAAFGKAVGYQDSLIYFAGGTNGSVVYNNVWVYNANTNTWRTASPLPGTRFGGAFSRSGDTLIYVGGADLSVFYATTYRGVISQADRSVITWTAGANFPAGVMYRMDAHPWGCKGVIVTGGSSTSAFTSVSAVAYSYSPGSNTWTSLTNKPTAWTCGQSGSVRLAGDIWKLVCASGYSGSGNITATEVFTDTLCPTATNTTLLLTHDSSVVNTQAERKRDRDSMRTYLGGIVGGYDFITFDSNTVLPSLTQYSRIVIQETAFDGQPARYLGLAQRNAIIAWLNSGTAGNRKTLVHIGGDLGYNYGRTGSGGLDLNFANTISGYNYKLDNAYPSPGNVVGVGVDVGNTRTISGTTNYYPDGCSLSNGSFPLYRYGNHTVADTLAGVMRYTPTYEVRALFSDPRYYSGAGGWQPVLAALLGAITGVNPVNNTVPEVYSLSQNYPNPFNPSTNIKFAIPQAGNVKMVVFDVLGREVVTLVNEFRQAGNYVVDFNASALSSGVYFYRIDAGNFTQTKKMLLVK
ncbi:MAG: T9SS type A sorting domain-containing protein, partial [Ignavibacteria bacterium]|nr:T9SS type A sorting domain-containing protein [Ignavibacteria bacterium]